MNSIGQEVMKNIKGKHVVDGSASSYAHSARVIGESSNNDIAFAQNAGNTTISVSDSSLWIVDSTGATDHMIHDVNLFYSRKLSLVLEIGLPNGSCNYVHEVGHIMLECGIVLKNVLFVPSFKYSLLSVGQLLDDDKVEVKFTST